MRMRSEIMSQCRLTQCYISRTSFPL